VINGIAGAGLMLACLAAFPGQAATTPAEALRGIGQAFGASDPLAAGVVAHVVVGVALGVLHAACVGDGAAKGLVGVGVFYAVVTWIVARVVTRVAFGGSLRPLVGSAPWFWAHVAFVAPLTCSSLAAHARQARRPAVTVEH